MEDYFELIKYVFNFPIGYIQVSQVPGRGEPDSPGEINYDYVFNLLKELDYTGWIGTEYKPTGKL